VVELPEPFETGEALEPAEVERVASSLERQEWLEKAGAWALEWLRSREALAEVNDKVRFSFGWPSGSRKAIGEAWHVSASREGVAEIFVSPALDTGFAIVEVLVHELIYAAMPEDEGHGKRFGKAARAADLKGKLTATAAGDELTWAVNA